MTDRQQIPTWLATAEEYEPERDKDRFIGKSILGILSLLERFRLNGGIRQSKADASFRLLTVIIIILLMALSKNLYFTYMMLAITVARMAFLNPKQLKLVVVSSLSAGFIAGIILLPAVFLGSPKSLVTVTMKAVTSVGLLQIISVTTQWNKITGALQRFYIPNVFILTLDLTIKYIDILGTMCQDMLQSLRLRSVGKNKKKANSASGILGVTFIKSREMAEDTYQAMICRGFDGEYKTINNKKFNPYNLIYVLLMIAAVVLFYYMQSLM